MKHEGGSITALGSFDVPGPGCLAIRNGFIKSRLSPRFNVNLSVCELMLGSCSKSKRSDIQKVKAKEIFYLSGIECQIPDHYASKGVVEETNQRPNISTVFEAVL